MGAASLAAWAFAIAQASSALTQFQDSEVSGPGSGTPLYLTRAGATFEDLGPGVLYNVYRRLPANAFRCLAKDLPAPAWAGDPDGPAAGAWWYAVNAFDGEQENRLGSTVGIAESCHPAEPIAVRKIARDVTVAPGGTTEFTLEVDNAAGGEDLIDCTLRDDVGASGCLRLLACAPATPPIAAVDCDLANSVVTASAFDVAAGTVQSLVLTVEVGSVTGTCENSFRVDCGGRRGLARAELGVMADCRPIAGEPPLGLELVASGLQSPVHLAAPPGDRRRLLVVEKAGRIRLIKDGVLLPDPFLDVTASVRESDLEQGLLSVAFHPGYGGNGRFFVGYTREPDGALTVAEYRRGGGEDVADPAGRVLLACLHPESPRHNSGQLAFGPRDGYLHVGTGDGGNSCDNPAEDAESLASCLGKVLRIDVDGSEPPLEYRIPPANPFVSMPGALPEIWAYGLRNPWRFSFDRLTGDLYIGDVGQASYEEVNVQPASSPGGEDYGWDLYEGNRHCPVASCPGGEGPCDPAGKTWPVVEYQPSTGCSAVASGHVYRGCRLPGYAGRYFYADFCSSRVWSFVYDAATGTALSPREWTADFPELERPASFGEDADGELYVVDFFGSIYRIAAR